MAKYTKNIYYSVRNGGDGSAHPTFFDSAELAQLDQDWQNEGGEGWGESCDGYITLESDSPIVCKEARTIADVIKDLEGERKWTKKEVFESKMKDLKELMDSK